jgi:hypothetical protein
MDKAKEEAKEAEQKARQAEKELSDLEKELEGKVKKPWNRLRKWRELKEKAEKARDAAEAAKDKKADIVVGNDTEGRDWEKEAEEAKEELERVERKLGKMPKERFKAWIDANNKYQRAMRNLRAFRRKQNKQAPDLDKVIEEGSSEPLTNIPQHPGLESVGGVESGGTFILMDPDRITPGSDLNTQTPETPVSQTEPVPVTTPEPVTVVTVSEPPPAAEPVHICGPGCGCND